jgi:hypothetical protein
VCAGLLRNKFLIIGLLIFWMPTLVFWSYVFVKVLTTPREEYGYSEFGGGGPEFLFGVSMLISLLIMSPFLLIIMIPYYVVPFYLIVYAILIYFHKKEKNRPSL